MILFWNKKKFDDAVLSKINDIFPILYSGTRGLNFNTTNLTLEEILTNWSFICIDLRATTISSVKSYAAKEKIDTGEYEYLDSNNWLNILIRQPNPYYSFSQLKYLLSSWLDISGNAYLYSPILSGKPGSLTVLPSNKVTPISKDGVIEAYEVRRDNGIVSTVSRENICHIKTLQPSNDWDKNFFIGTGRVHAAAKAIGADAAIVDFVNRFAESDGISPFILSTARAPTPMEKQSFKEQFLENTENKYPFLGVVGGGAQLEQLSTNMNNTIKDTVTNSAGEDVIRRIGRVFGIPYSKLVAEYQNKATADTTEDVYREETVEPFHNLIDQEINNYIQQFDDIQIVHDVYKRVEPEEERKQNQFELDNSLILVNEMRKQNGDEPIEGGDVPLIKVGYTTLANVANPAPPPEPEPEKEDDEGKNDLFGLAKLNGTAGKALDIIKALAWKNFDEVGLQAEKQLTKEITAVFNSMEKSLLSKFSRKSIKVGVEESIDLSAFEDIIIEQTKDTTQKHAYSVIELSYGLANQGINETLLNEQLRGALELSTDKIQPSINVIEKDLKKSIQKYVNDNTFITENELREGIRGLIKNKFDIYTDSRVNNIARTTTTAQNGFCQKEVWQEDLKLKTVWLSSRDGKTRKTHWKADGKEADDKGYFRVGGDKMEYPGGGSDAEENCNCRCQLFPETK